MIYLSQNTVKMPYGLNDEQYNAINSPSPTIINASAGSGKTRCLVAKVQSLLDNGVNPRNILAITFTNKAANEMKERLRSSYRGDLSEMQISTIHSMCVKIIRKFPGEIGLRVPFSIYDEDEQKAVIKTLLKARGMADDPYEVLATISRAKGDLTEDYLEPRIAEIHKRYQEVLTVNNAADFDDLLIYAYEILLNDQCAEYFINLWQHILVDEIQDTSRLQYNIIQCLYEKEKTKTLFLVGDLNQSIYGFRSARPQNMMDFIKEHNPTVCNLTYNYRSCQDIITHANNYLQYGKTMVAKSGTIGKVSCTIFTDLENEAESIAIALKQMGGYDQTAIIYRMNSRSLQFEKAFLRHKIPYKIAGYAFYSRKVSRDILAYLKACKNPADMESFLRILNVPKRGFGESKQERFMHEGMPYLLEVAKEMPTIAEFLKLLEDIRDMKPIVAVSEILSRTGYRKVLDKESDRDMVDAFLDASSGFQSIEDMILAASFMDKDTGSGVSLVTAHASKGLEWDRVFVVGVEEDIWPHKFSADLAEEERLYYVALTRAKRYLNISCSKSRNYKGTVISLFPSQFFRKSYHLLTGKEYQLTIG